MSRLQVTAQYAGVASRAVAAALDLGFILLSSTLLISVADVLSNVLLDVSVSDTSGVVASLALLAWAVTYTAVSTAVTGRTVGKAVVGLKIVARDGTPLRPGSALVRALTFLPSTSLAAVGLLMIAIHPRHRALHDLAAGTAVVYDWGDRPAELPAPLTAYLRDRV